MRTINCKTLTHTNKETMSVICKTLSKAFKPSNLKKTDIQHFQVIITFQTFRSYVLVLFSVFSNFWVLLLLFWFAKNYGRSGTYDKKLSSLLEYQWMLIVQDAKSHHQVVPHHWLAVISVLLQHLYKLCSVNLLSFEISVLGFFTDKNSFLRFIAWFKSKLLPLGHLGGKLETFLLYRSAFTSRNSFLFKSKPCSFKGNTVSQLDAPFSLICFNARFELSSNWFSTSSWCCFCISEIFVFVRYVLA